MLFLSFISLRTKRKKILQEICLINLVEFLRDVQNRKRDYKRDIGRRGLALSECGAILWKVVEV